MQGFEIFDGEDIDGLTKITRPRTMSEHETSAFENGVVL